MLIRTIEPQDTLNVTALIQTAFTASEHGYGGEVGLVNELRKDATYQATLEVVAVDQQTIMGHGLLSEIQIGEHRGLALAPLAVLPTQQRQGIGGQIIQALETRAQQAGYRLISILGDPQYYSRFGYEPANDYQITAPFEVPADAYLIKALVPDGLNAVHGMVSYRPAFGIE
ncbi:GNAT family N-acetyltransferase [Latilactobacillus fuchuensis]|uniref:GNAT family N-acetyltransferase n=1 Tax=Latilactobacillus fuchuensis TaxID=164393 RepID=UPI0020C75EC2|nr:N-acetyltransferase [Latilactobacillus fuchuensis]MCP8857014.1 N-acetyltransferase [Latilactobacillus fuchuensis]